MHSDPGRTHLRTPSAAHTAAFRVQNLVKGCKALGIRTPLAAHIAAGKKDRGANPVSVVYTVMLYIDQIADGFPGRHIRRYYAHCVQ